MCKHCDCRDGGREGPIAGALGPSISRREAMGRVLAGAAGLMLAGAGANSASAAQAPKAKASI